MRRRCILDGRQDHQPFFKTVLGAPKIVLIGSDLRLPRTFRRSSIARRAAALAAARTSLAMPVDDDL